MRALVFGLLVGCGEPAAPPVVVPIASASATAAPIHSSGVVDTPPRELEQPRERLSYEQALGRYNESEPHADLPPAPLTDAQLNTPLRDASQLGRCGASSYMHVTIRLAVRGGHAVGVTVATKPADSKVRACIEDWVWSLSWPSSRKLDTFTTAY